MHTTRTIPTRKTGLLLASVLLLAACQNQVAKQLPATKAKTGVDSGH